MQNANYALYGIEIASYHEGFQQIFHKASQ